MKRFISLITLFFSIGLSAQNWNPISLIIDYNYKIDTAQLITNTILVDSFSVNNNDTTFYLNRIMADCDTCSYVGYKLINQPQFLMKQVLKIGDSLFIFQNPTEFQIYPLKNLNDTWVFDSLNSVIATIDSVYIDTIFGINDSIKRINLSSGSNIILSKKFGIIKFPSSNGYNYELIGINNNLGEQLPRFWDFFNYEVNDTLQWKYYSWCAGPGASNTIKITKAIITSKTMNGDTVHYQVQGIERRDGGYLLTGGTWIIEPTVFTPINTTLSYIYSTSHSSNSYPNQTHSYPFSSIYFNTWSVLYQENGLQKKLIDFINLAYWNTPPADNFDPLHFYGSAPPHSKKVLFTKGLGVCIEDRYVSTCGIEECMQGRIHLGDTIGSVYPDSFFVIGVKENINKDNLIIYPNPASHQLIIETDLMINRIDIMDITGKMIKTIKENTSIINIVDIPNGIYFIMLNTDEMIITRKFIKQ